MILYTYTVQFCPKKRHDSRFNIKVIVVAIIVQSFSNLHHELKDRFFAIVVNHLNTRHLCLKVQGFSKLDVSVLMGCNVKYKKKPINYKENKKQNAQIGY